jgi:hypothetical protein
MKKIFKSSLVLMGVVMLSYSCNDNDIASMNKSLIPPDSAKGSTFISFVPDSGGQWNEVDYSR